MGGTWDGDMGRRVGQMARSTSGQMDRWADSQVGSVRSNRYTVVIVLPESCLHNVGTVQKLWMFWQKNTTTQGAFFFYTHESDQRPAPPSLERHATKQPLLRLEQENGAVSKVEVNEMLRLCSASSLACHSSVAHPTLNLIRTMGYEAAKVPAHNAVPRSSFSVVKLCTWSEIPLHVCSRHA